MDLNPSEVGDFLHLDPFHVFQNFPNHTHILTQEVQPNGWTDKPKSEQDGTLGRAWLGVGEKCSRLT